MCSSDLEYQNAFGEWTVPYQKGWKTESCTTMQEFTWSFQLLRGNSSSSLKGDLSGISSKLGGAAYQNNLSPSSPHRPPRPRDGASVHRAICRTPPHGLVSERAKRA